MLHESIEVRSECNSVYIHIISFTGFAQWVCSVASLSKPHTHTQYYLLLCVTLENCKIRFICQSSQPRVLLSIPRLEVQAGIVGNRRAPRYKRANEGSKKLILEIAPRITVDTSVISRFGETADSTLNINFDDLGSNA